ncbi:Hypothetical predicted protein [Olea europaea subsp. europaea]|uniref:Uncharacterized protein n=1 Tax=Olea europaea subsp. europaea TaxID=158383 RepID=A0A8S0TPD5_OLEEU|nr:Hypothetical predicted protein [Olea europaea subsp. europaea]
MQIWAHEAIPSIRRRYGENLQEANSPRICRWDSSKMPNYKDIGASMDGPNIVVHCTLKPTPEEAFKAYWIEIHRLEDEVEDPTVDIFVLIFLSKLATLLMPLHLLGIHLLFIGHLLLQMLIHFIRDHLYHIHLCIHLEMSSLRN